MTGQTINFARVKDGTAITGLCEGTVLMPPEWLKWVVRTSREGGFFPYTMTYLGTMDGLPAFHMELLKDIRL